MSVKTEQTFAEHQKTCPECGGGMIGPDGKLLSLCEEGYRLLQQDLKKGKKEPK
jgi:hypothetical protein